MKIPNPKQSMSLWHFPLDKLVIWPNGTTIEDGKCRVLVPRKKGRTRLAKLLQKLRFSLFNRTSSLEFPLSPRKWRSQDLGSERMKLGFHSRLDNSTPADSLNLYKRPLPEMPDSLCEFLVLLIEEFRDGLRRKLKANFIKFSGKNNRMGKLTSWQLPGGGIWRKGEEILLS